MKPLLLLTAFAGLAALSACESTDTAPSASAAATAFQQPGSAEAECTRFGYQAGTQPYQSCVTDMQRQERTLAMGRKMTADGRMN
ncbi:hypothetical protein LQ948_15535 [Jiella sp. MQZ9-1]|uniref:Lipoprotein n=1 Tax=Jiella flava TaxID=2816857 RepID=A0A939G1F9_9HYPH|nr:hypothetical protein [Jiella flava]MBO0664046.1 hypothetical protein [Jiella flava]MCD2472618.1 hypothetical protein [Jiella flava]